MINSIKKFLDYPSDSEAEHKNTESDSSSGVYFQSFDTRNRATFKEVNTINTQDSEITSLFIDNDSRKIRSTCGGYTAAKVAIGVAGGLALAGSLFGVGYTLGYFQTNTALTPEDQKARQDLLNLVQSLASSTIEIFCSRINNFIVPTWNTLSPYGKDIIQTALDSAYAARNTTCNAIEFSYFGQFNK